MHRLQWACAAALSGALVCVGAPAMAQYPPASDEECVRTLDEDGSAASIFEPGEVIVAEGEATDPADARCFDPGSDVRITFIQSEVHLATVSADGRGDYTTAGLGVRIPEGASPGSARIEARGTIGEGPITYSRAIRIDERPPALPVTGRDIAWLTLWGVALIVAGSILISATWRRWQTARHNTLLAREAAGAPSVLWESVDVHDGRLSPPAVASEDPPDAARSPSPLAWDRDEQAALPADGTDASAEGVSRAEENARGSTEGTRHRRDSVPEVIARIREQLRSWGEHS